MYRFGDWLGLAFVVAIIYVIVRPNSKAGETVTAFTSMLVSMIRRATDLASGTA